MSFAMFKRPHAPQCVRKPRQLPWYASTIMKVSTEHHTITSMYIGKQNPVNVPEMDWLKRRKERDTQEIIQAAVKADVGNAESVHEGLRQLEHLLPDLIPNLDRMKATDWAKLASNPQAVAMKLITLKTAYPSANISTIVARNPKILLQDVHTMQDNAEQVTKMLSKIEDLGALVQAVPDLMNPQAVANSLSNLQRWFPDQDPMHILATNPTLLLNIEEADLEADPVYGEITTAG